MSNFAPFLLAEGLHSGRGKTEFLPRGYLGGISMNWPLGEDGKPEKAVELLCEPDRTAFFNAKLYLQSMDIPVLEAFSDEVPFTTVLFGEALRGGTLYVPESLREDALYLLQNPAEQIDKG